MTIDLDELERVARARMKQTSSPTVTHSRERRFTRTFTPSTVLALIAAARGGVPDGFKLVPVEPTREMVRAGDGKDPGFGSLAAEIYRAMLAAAPAPPTKDQTDEA